MGGGFETHVIECSLRHRDGTWLQFEVQHTDLLQDEHVRGVVLNSRDVSERKAFEDQLAHQALHDPVTSLANRALFADRVQHSIMRSIRVRRSASCSSTWTTSRPSTTASATRPATPSCRKWRDACWAPCGQPTRSRASAATSSPFCWTASRTRGGRRRRRAGPARTRSSVDVDGKQVYPRASVGICLAGQELGSSDAEELLRNADVAMYMAKRDSKGSYRVFEPAMHERVVERLELQAELQRALELGQLVIHYQPVVRLDQRNDYGGGAAPLDAPDADDPAAQLHSAR